MILFAIGISLPTASRFHVISQRWVVNKQMRLEGGFQGRTNKLVDGCYSFWQSGAFPLIAAILKQGKSAGSFISDHWLFNQEALQEYILICCQDPHGGILDKPGKYVIVMHSYVCD